MTGASPGPFFDSPDSTRPLHPWPMGRRDEESPVSTAGEKAYFSPYSSNYTSPVSAVDQVQVIGREWPTDRKGSPAQTSREWPMDRKGSFGDHRAANLRSRSREKKPENEGDRIEMQNVAPVLLHPGHGRGGSLGLTEEDARRGNAV